MKALVLFACLAASCLAQRPRPCRSPPLLTGSFTVSSSCKKLSVFGKYSYDALGKRIRLREIGHHDNKTFHLDVLLLFRERVLYKISYRNRTCIKKRLNAHFHPLAIPRKASLLGQAVLGSSSGPGQGLLVNTWVGELKMRNGTGKYMSTVTEFGCIPISTVFSPGEHKWSVTSFFDNVMGITDPQKLNPPPFCKDAEVEDVYEEEPADFFNLLEESEQDSEM